MAKLELYHHCGCGPDKQVEPHACPYDCEINDDPRVCCTCCEDCEQRCADDV